MTSNSGYVNGNNYQMQIHQTNDESVASTRRMLAHLSEADGAATDTMANLDTQREQLKRMNRQMTTIDAETREAQKNLTNLEKFCGLCTCPCRRPSKLKDHKSSRSEAYTKTTASSSTRTNGAGGSKTTKGGYINKVTGDAREDEMDDNLDEVSNYLTSLKMKAKAIGEEVDAQDRMIDELKDRTETNKENIARSNQQALRALKNN